MYFPDFVKARMAAGLLFQIIDRKPATGDASKGEKIVSLLYKTIVYHIFFRNSMALSISILSILLIHYDQSRLLLKNCYLQHNVARQLHLSDRQVVVKVLL
jgi:hypothetical protein